MRESDKTTYAPFVLITGDSNSLILSDEHMPERMDVFEERTNQGWTGNGHDWASIADLILAEKLPELAAQIALDPEAGMFAAIGPEDALRQLGTELKRAFADPALLREYLSRAQQH